MPETEPDTRTRILDAAERLFAEHGYDGTAIRAVTREAGVNAAAVHYHFGGKEGLLEEVFERILVPVNRSRIELLQRAEQESAPEPPAVESIVWAFVAPGLGLLAEDPERGPLLARFLGRAHSEPADVVRDLVRTQFSELGRRFHGALCRALPDRSPNELFERLHWVVGILTYLLGAPYGIDVRDAEALTPRLVAFASAGIRGPGEVAVPEWGPSK